MICHDFSGDITRYFQRTMHVGQETPESADVFEVAPGFLHVLDNCHGTIFVKIVRSIDNVYLQHMMEFI